MQLPSPDPQTLFEDLLQDLLSETMTMAYEVKAFTHARKIKTPHQLLRVVLLYCGLDHSLPEVAGTLLCHVNAVAVASVGRSRGRCVSRTRSAVCASYTSPD